MSIEVGLDRLRDEVSRFGPAAFLLTVRAGRPHVVSVSVVVDGAELAVVVGKRSAANAIEVPAVALLWPGSDEADFSLIVDGEARADAAEDEAGDQSGAGPGATLRIRPAKAVLHRARAAVEPGAAGSDCRPVLDRRPPGV
jgi:hypothetical protein